MLTKKFRPLGLALGGLLLLSAGPARAEPPLMKEQSVQPRIQAVSPDGRFASSLGGFVQARYTMVNAEAEADESHFGAPRTRLYAFGHVHSPDFRYRLMVGTPPFSQQLQLFDAYLEGRVADELRLRVGRFKLPVFREWVESARLLASVERSSLTLLLLPGRDYGLMASGTLGQEDVEYAIGIFNGAGDVAAKDSNTSPAVAGRAVWNVTHRSIEGEIDFHDSPSTLSLGVSGFSTWRPVEPTASPEPGRPHLREQMAGAEIAFRWRGLDLTAEVMGRVRDQAGARQSVLGGYVRADKYLPLVRSSVGARAVRIVGLGDPSQDRTEVEVDLGHFVEEHDLKFIVNLGAARTGREARFERFVLAQAQVAF